MRRCAAEGGKGLQFELFQAKLTAEDLAGLEHEARARVKPHIGLSPERQLDAHKDDISEAVVCAAQRSGAGLINISYTMRHKRKAEEKRVL